MAASDRGTAEELESLCPLCAHQLAFWCKKTSRADGLAYPIWKCSGCRSGFVVPRPTAEYLEHFYTSELNSQVHSLIAAGEANSYEQVMKEEREFPNSTLDAKRMAGLCRAFAPGSNFLDVGAGQGFFSRAALDHGFKVTAIEPAEPSRKVFESMNGFSPIASMLTDDFVDGHKESMDVVLLSQVLEHVADVNLVVSQISALLKEQGIAAIAVPHFGSWFSRIQGENDMFLIPPEHLNFFSQCGLQSLFKKHRFECLKSMTVSRLNARRLAARLHLGPLSPMIKLATRAVCTASDVTGGGMFINAYFSKLR